MRERKFRAWDTEKEIMANVTSMGFDDLDVNLKDEDCIYWSTVYPYIARVMECTGFTDTNDIEIYEGDIVVFKGHKFKIIFEIGSFMLVKINDKTDMYSLFKECWNDNVYPLSQLLWNHEDCFNTVFYNLKVVGNIYENKELLK